MALLLARRRLAQEAGRLARSLGSVRYFQGSGDAGQSQPKAVPLAKLKDSFLDGTSSTYLEELEEKFRLDPHSVDKSWAGFFKSLGALAGPGVMSLLYRAGALGPQLRGLYCAAGAGALGRAADSSRTQGVGVQVFG